MSRRLKTTTQNDSRRGGRQHNPRRWALRLALVAAACIPVIVAESVMRIVPDAPPTNDMIDDRVGDPLFIAETLPDGSRWRTIDSRRSNFFYPQSFPTPKPASTCRIFVVGGSTVAGRPWATETSMSRWLQMRLDQSRRPDFDAEVINVGGVSYGSHRLRRVVGELLSYEPDVIVLYTGHNEFLEDRTFAAVRNANAVIRFANAIAERSELIRRLKRSMKDHSLENRSEEISASANLAARREPSGAESGGSRRSANNDADSDKSWNVDTRLDHVDGMDRYVRDPAWRTAVEEAFDATLKNIATDIENAGVTLVLCVPASDCVETPPFKSTLLAKHQSTLSGDAETLRNADANFDQRMRAARSILAVDPMHADANYFLGRNRLDEQNLGDAAVHLLAARDHDVCPLRATGAIESSVRRLADRRQIPLIDVPKLLSHRDLDACTDPKFFVDHVHPTMVGHQRIAKAIHQTLVDAKLTPQIEFDDAGYAASIRQHLSELGEDYFARGQQRLEGLQRWARIRAD